MMTVATARLRLPAPIQPRPMKWLFLAVLVVSVSCGTARAAGPRAAIDGRHASLLADHCRTCHGPDKQESGFRVDDLPLVIDTVAAAERWQKVLNALNSGEMPPEDKPRIDPAAKTEFLDDLAEAMVVARKSLADQGGVIPMRRLNRREYANTLRDLLGVEVNVSDLPADTSPLSFDTVGAGLFMTAGQFEQYEAIGREALALARWAAAGKKLSWRFEAESTMPKFRKTHEEFTDVLRRSEAWFAALEAAKARPENAALLAELRKADPDEKKLMHQWQRFIGMPPPEDFGFVTSVDRQFNPGGVARNVSERQFVAYEQHYLSLPHLDTGAYLATKYGAANSNIRFQFGIPPDWPPGECIVRIRCGSNPAVPESRRYLEFANWSMSGPQPPRAVHQVTGTIESPQVFETPITIGPHSDERMNARIYLFRERGTGPDRDADRLFKAGLKENGIGPEPAIWVDWIDVERRTDSLADAPAGIRPLVGAGISLVDSPEPVDPGALRAAVTAFCAATWRGVAVPEDSVDRLLSIYQSRRALGGGHLEALKETLASAMSAPRFLYRAEPGPAESRRELDGVELATRLSYFLWGRPPDTQLRSLAADGRLIEPEVLVAQTDRLLDDPRSRGFVEPFLTQWLSMERLDFFEVNSEHYPRFDRAMKESARREVYETFMALLRDDGSIRDLLKADSVVVDALLATYYGLDGVTGDEFRRVSLPAGSPRGGLLGMAAIHVMGSNGEQSSPVERGVWVLRKLLNDPPPPAPPNVPQLARLAGKSLTARERIVIHQEEPQCASCHRKIDPIGFGLENFDAVGQWRTTDSYIPLDENGKQLGHLRKTWTIDPSGRIHGGPPFAEFFELRAIVASRSDDFSRGFAAALVEYALGRPCGFSDEPLVDSIVNTAKGRDLSPRSFIHALVQSRQFRTK